MLQSINGTARIVRDIEMLYTSNGVAIAKTAIVNSRKWKDKNSGELMEESCFIDVVAFGNTAEFLNNHFEKGDILTYVGYLQQEKWKDHNGNNRSKHSIRLEQIDFGLSSKGSGNSYTPKPPQERGTPVTYGKNEKTQPPEQPVIPEIDIMDDEIPF